MPFTPTRHGFHLGPLGRLQLVRAPGRGYKPAPELAVTAHKLLSGRVRTNRPPFAARSYALSFDAMSDEEKAWIEQCALGYVKGPLYWVDPLVRNQLPPWLSVPTPTLEGFASTYGTMAYSATGSQGFTGLQWTVPAMASPTRQYVNQATGGLVVAGLTFTASAYVSRVSGGEAAMTSAVYVNWYDSAGTYVTTYAGTAVALATVGTTYRVSFSGAPPANAATARVFVSLVPHGTLSTTLAIDGMQVEFGALSAFAPGPGLAKVAILSYQPDVYLSGVTNVALAMQEVR